MFGWKGRIGLLVPSTNVTVEAEFQRAVPEGVTVHTARCMLYEVSKEKDLVESLLEMNMNIARAAREVACIQPKVIVWACTGSSFAQGLGHDQEIIRDIKSATGIASLTTSTAVVRALKTLGVKKLAVATPYIKELDEREVDFLEQSLPGLKVVSIRGLGILSNFEKGNLAPYTAYEAAREVITKEAEAVFISCTAWRTFEIIEHLERDTGKPVITSNQAALWAALKMMGISGPTGLGILMRR